MYAIRSYYTPIIALWFEIFSFVISSMSNFSCGRQEKSILGLCLFSSLKAIITSSRQALEPIPVKLTAISRITSYNVCYTKLLRGVGVSYPLLPAISKVFEQQSGLKWA